MSHRVVELAQRQVLLQKRCAAQRSSVALEVAGIEARFAAIDRIAGLVRSTMLHPAVIVGGIVALIVVGRAGGLRLVGRALLLGVAARRLLQVLKQI
jgi:hypothetical protein